MLLSWSLPWSPLISGPHSYLMSISEGMELSNVNRCRMKKRIIAPERTAHLLENPDAQLITFGIGDATEPIPEDDASVLSGLPHGSRATVPTFYKNTYKIEVYRNAYIAKLQAGYLFPEIARRREAHKRKYPDAKVISLGIGDITEPISKVITSAMAKPLRAAIALTFYGDLGIGEEDIYVSDGAKCDISHLQIVFGSDVTIAVQDPSDPAFVDSGVIMGQTGQFQQDIEKYGKMEYMKCTPENGSFPDLSTVARTDNIYFCSPNNPSGSAPTREQLTRLVKFAKDNGSIVVYDSAYAMYLSDDRPQIIFEIPGAKEVAIETSSFSKYAGFTGIHLGWTVVPKDLLFAAGFPVAKDFNRFVCTCYNGAGNISQAGGLACLSPEGLSAMREADGFYKQNTEIIVDTLSSLGFKAYGGKNAPYVWVHFPGEGLGISSTRFSRRLMVTTPGSGFGPIGEGFICVVLSGIETTSSRLVRGLSSCISESHKWESLLLYCWGSG